MTSISIIEYPNCTWEYEGGNFYCTHDEREVEMAVEDHLGFEGHYQTESEIYVCAECGESLEGSPEFDRAEYEAEAEAEAQLMELLGK